MDQPLVKIKKLHPDAVVPKYAHAGDAGADLFSVEDVFIPRGETVCIKTGLSMEIQEGHELQVRPKSGLALKKQLGVANAPGTVDAKLG